ncbi:MAG: hypothetical protein WD042_10355 [Phycisphaeraceae bacterium]
MVDKWLNRLKIARYSHNTQEHKRQGNRLRIIGRQRAQGRESQLRATARLSFGFLCNLLIREV